MSKAKEYNSGRLDKDFILGLHAQWKEYLLIVGLTIMLGLPYTVS